MTLAALHALKKQHTVARAQPSTAAAMADARGTAARAFGPTRRDSQPTSTIYTTYSTCATHPST